MKRRRKIDENFQKKRKVFLTSSENTINKYNFIHTPYRERQVCERSEKIFFWLKSQKTFHPQRSVRRKISIQHYYQTLLSHYMRRKTREKIIFPRGFSSVAIIHNWVTLFFSFFRIFLKKKKGKNQLPVDSKQGKFTWEMPKKKIKMRLKIIANLFN